MKMAVGQKLWWVPSGRLGEPCEVVVTKVGRVWAHLSNQYRIGIESMLADGGVYASPGRCWISRDEYRKHVETVEAWNALMNDLRCHRLADGIGISEINKVREILGMEAGQ